jgi:hypothetical protein
MQKLSSCYRGGNPYGRWRRIDPSFATFGESFEEVFRASHPAPRLFQDLQQCLHDLIFWLRLRFVTNGASLSGWYRPFDQRPRAG